MTDQKRQAITELIEDINKSDLDLSGITLLQFGVSLLKTKEQADKRIAERKSDVLKTG